MGSSPCWGVFCCIEPCVPICAPQSVNRRRKQFLTRCKAHIEIDDVAPYHHILEGLAFLKNGVMPRKYDSKSQRRKTAKRLRNILEGTYERMKSMAKGGYNGMAQLLYTEIAGHGGLAIFRRMDAAVRACERVQVVGGDGGLRKSGTVAPRGRGRSSYSSRGRGGRPRDLSGVQCHNCFKYGHFQSNCPAPSKAGGDANK